jgi:hypothetical protein
MDTQRSFKSGQNGPRAWYWPLAQFKKEWSHTDSRPKRFLYA